MIKNKTKQKKQWFSTLYQLLPKISLMQLMFVFLKYSSY